MTPAEDCSLSRRALLSRGAAVGLAAMAAPSVLPRYAFAAADSGSHRPAGRLVVVFLRGAVDGLSLVVPHHDANYYKLRPTLAVPAKSVHDLDGRFGLHPSLAPLMPLWRKNELAVVQATGLDTTADYSHFDAQATMEAGSDDPGLSTGWLARHLLCRPQATDTLRAVSFGQHVAASLVGWGHTTAMTGLEAFQLDTAPAAYELVMKALDRLYSDSGRPATEAAHETFNALQRVAAVRASSYTPSHNVSYPTSLLGAALLDIAKVIKDVPQLEAVTVDAYGVDAFGWDTHAGQNIALPPLLADLAACLTAFVTDLDDEMHNTTVVVMSEFGRRVEENSAGGTDHGHGNVMFVLGRGIHGGKVFTKWPGLGDKQLDYGDLAVTTDYRQVVGDVIAHRLGNPRIGQVFPGLAFSPVGLTHIR
ncbi:MAG TPA: DUF1501 domain-containing protein [Mycobacteriales bacterium]|nr:DUF1501 domain-containing protein [Mycobacteriales bacterium]